MDWWTGVNPSSVSGAVEPLVSQIESGGIFDPWINCDELDLGTILHQVSSTSSSSSSSSSSSGTSAGGVSSSNSSLGSATEATTSTGIHCNDVQRQIRVQQLPALIYQQSTSNSGSPDTDSNNNNNTDDDIGAQLCTENESEKPGVVETASLAETKNDTSSASSSPETKANQSLFSQMFLANNAQSNDYHNNNQHQNQDHQTHHHHHHHHHHHQQQQQQQQQQLHQEQQQTTYSNGLWQKQANTRLAQPFKSNSLLLDNAIVTPGPDIVATKREPQDSSYEGESQSCCGLRNESNHFDHGHQVHYRASPARPQPNQHESQFLNHNSFVGPDDVYNQQHLIGSSSSPSLASTSSPASSLADIFQQVGGAEPRHTFSGKLEPNLDTDRGPSKSSTSTLGPQQHKSSLKSISNGQRPAITSNQQNNKQQPPHQKTRRCRHITDYVLAEEEKRLLIKEGYTDFPLICQARPLSKSEERILRKIRRKIRNKKSAQCSRQRKKEYVEDLERKYATVIRENEELRLILNKFQQHQQQQEQGRSQTTPSSIMYPLIARDSEIGSNNHGITPTTTSSTNNTNIQHHHQINQQHQQVSQNHLPIESGQEQLTTQLGVQQHLGVSIDWRDVFGPPAKAAANQLESTVPSIVNTIYN